VEGVEFLRDVTLGQYLPGRSITHRLDPRAKLVVLILLIWAITSTTAYLAGVVLLASMVGLIVVSELPIGYVLRGIRPVLPFLVIFLVFQILFAGNYDPSGSPVLWTWTGPEPVPIRFTVTEASLRLSIVSIARLFCLLIVTSILTFTTTTTGLTHGLESLLAPLRPLRVPSHELAMMLAIALRFVPTLAEELERIVKAQASRGADFGRPGRFGFIQRARMLVPIVVPLFVGVFRRAEDLVLAMEARCYVGGAGRTRLAELRMRPLDWAVLVTVAAYVALMLLTPWPV
jgi:energy-coupling factor transport system permease protein